MHFIDTSRNRPKDDFFKDMDITPPLQAPQFSAFREHIKGGWGWEERLYISYTILENEQ